MHAIAFFVSQILKTALDQARKTFSSIGLSENRRLERQRFQLG